MRRRAIFYFFLLALTGSGIACRRDTAPPTSSSPAVASAVLPPSTPVSDPASLLKEAAQTPATEYAKVRQEIDATIKAKPQNFEIRMQAAEFYMKASDYKAALPHLEVATRLSPHKALPWIALGDAASLEGRFETGAAAYRHAAAIDPNNPQIVRGLGQMYVLQRKWKDAQRVLEQGLARHPKDAEIRTVLGNLYLVINKPREAAAVIKPALEQQPDRADLHYMLGEAYERDLHIEAAIQEMQAAVGLEPGNAEAWGRLGLYENNLTRYTEARDPLQRAIALAPREPHYYWALGDSYLLENTSPANFDRAAELYRKALSLDNNNAKALYSFGMALTRRGRPEDLQEAVSLFQRLIQIKSIDMNAHYKLAETYRRLGKDKEAAAEQAKFQDLFSKSKHQTHKLLASVAFKDTPEVHVKLGRQAMAQQDYSLAATEYQLALTRDPNSAAARDGLRQAQQKTAAGQGKRP